MQGCRANAFLLTLQLFLGVTGNGNDAEGKYGHTDINKQLYLLSLHVSFSLLYNDCMLCLSKL